MTSGESGGSRDRDGIPTDGGIWMIGGTFQESVTDMTITG